MKRILVRLVRGLSLLCLLVLGSIHPLHGQSPATGAKLPTTPAVANIPQDAIGYVAIHPTAIRKLPVLQYLPWEVVSAWSLQQVGLDLTEVESIEAVFGNPVLGLPYAVRITSVESVDESELSERLFVEPEWKVENGLRIRQVRGAPGAVLHLIDAKHGLVGPRAYVEKMLKTDGKLGKLATLVSKLQGSADLSVVATLEDFRPMLEGFAESSQDRLPNGIGRDLGVLASNVNHVEIHYDAQKYGRLNVRLSSSPENIQKVNASFRNLMTNGSKFLIDDLKKNLNAKSTKTELAVVAYFDRISAKLIGELEPKVAGDRLEIELQRANPILLSSSVTGALLPAVQSARTAARRMQSSNNLKQLAIAIHNYEATYKRLPRDIVDEEGNPLLSWRVAILPFIEYAQLYGEFRLDEPWDSEHNIQLLDKMPAILRNPESPATLNETTYLAIVGEGLGFGSEEVLSFRDFTDGLSNTIWLVEASDTRAVPWSSPADLEPKEDNPTDGLRFDGVNPGCNVSLGDGSVRFISSSIDPSILWKMFTRSGGEPVGF